MNRLIRSFAFACAGLKSSFISELNFRIHLASALLVFVLGLLLKISVQEWLAAGFCIALVTAMEMINTAIEKLCDVVQEEFHPGIKKVKDIAAGAVLLSAIFSVITGAVIFIPKIIVYF